MGTIGIEGDEALADAGLLVSAVYQPVIELESGGVVGYEALARGPQGGELEHPDKLLSAARRAGLLAQVDWECRLAAVSGALDAGLDRSTTLFLNMEPEAVGPSARGDGRTPELWQRAEQALSVAVELPAGALRARPRELVRAADACRDRGWKVVLDDVGADRGSLAVLPLVAPDAIKLDLRAARAAGPQAPALSDVATAVWAEQERTGAAIVAEGIETERQLEQARGIGATLGQGWLWGRPGALPTERAATAADTLPRGGIALTGTPFELIAGTRTPREGSAAMLGAMSRHLEHLAGGLGADAIVLAAFQESANLSGRVRNRYRQLAEAATLVGALRRGRRPAAGRRRRRRRPRRRRRAAAGVGGRRAGADLRGGARRPRPRRRPGDDAGEERRYRFVLTHDRDDVVAAARSLAARLG